MRLLLVAAFVGLALAGCVQPGPAHVVAYTATDFAFEGPAELEAGWTEVRLSNHGMEPHQAVFLKIEGEHTLEDLHAIEGHLPEWLVPFGGPGVVEPGKDGAATILLEEGRYVIICEIPSPDGVPHFHKGMVKEVEVKASDARSGEPAHDVEVTLGDYHFDAGEVGAGMTTFKVSNGGDHAHEAILIRYHGDATLADVLESFGPNATGPPPADFVSGVGAMAPGQWSTFTADMTAGRYVWICFLPGPEGAPHFALGMQQEFSVA